MRELRARQVFEALGGTAVNPATVMDASVPLELSGEAVRTRLCLFLDERGREKVLRPDLTLPIAQDEASARASGQITGETLYTYSARAFRLPAVQGDAMEFTQVGFERFGAVSSPQSDADAFGAVAAAAHAAGGKPDRVYMGDLAIFPAFVDTLNLPEAVAGLIKRAFRQAGGVETVLADQAPFADAALAAQLRAAQDAAGDLERVLAERGYPLIGHRSADEIAAGILEKAAAAERGGVPGDARDLLRAVSEVQGAPHAAAAALRSLAEGAGAADMPAIATLEARIGALEAAAPDLMAKAQFGTPFGRRFTYYDGFVFEVFAAGASHRTPYAAGGRYDALVSDLSGGVADVSAVGGVVRPGRMGGV